jgi:parallel beta-helix repeat protein
MKEHYIAGLTITCMFLVSMTAAAWNPDTNLSDSNASFYADLDYSRSGFALAIAGDVNGDGYDDLIIGGRNNSEHGLQTGQSYLVLGSSTGWSMDYNLSAANASFHGERAGESGYSLAAAGDVNGDGFDDFIIGAFTDDEFGVGYGQSYLIFGASSGWTMDVNLSEANASYVGERDANSGVSVAGIGDVNGDGFDDFAIGAYRDNELLANSGQTYVIFGGPTGYSRDTSVALSNASFLGERLGAFSGVTLAGLGDVNGDGFDDFMIGAYMDDEAGMDYGQSYLILGGTTNWGLDTNLFSSNASFIGERASLSGSGIDGVGDVNGDGYDDFVIGASDDNEYGMNCGQSYLVFGGPTGWGMDISLATSNASFIGERDNAFAGSRIAGVGDVNGDGFDDFTIGAYDDNEHGSQTGQTYLIFGRPGGWGMDTNLSEANASFHGERLGQSGRGIDGVGDVNGDGFHDFVVGASYDSEAAPQVGQSYLVYGDASGLTTKVINSVSFGNESDFSYSGTSVAVAAVNTPLYINVTATGGSSSEYDIVRVWVNSSDVGKPVKLACMETTVSSGEYHCIFRVRHAASNQKHRKVRVLNGSTVYVEAVEDSTRRANTIVYYGDGPQAYALVQMNLTDEWPMFRRFANHTGYSNETGPDNLSNTYVESIDLGSTVVSSPAVAGCFVYISGGDDQFYQLNASNITLIHGNFSTGNTVSTSPAVYGDYVYAAGNDGNVYQLNASNISQMIASFSTGAVVMSSPTLSGGYVYIGSNDFNVYQLNADNISQLVANYTTYGAVQSTPAVCGDSVYVGGNDFNVYQLNSSNVSIIIANFSTFNSFRSSPAVAGGFVYIGGDDGMLYQLDAANVANLVANFSTGGWIISSAAVAGGFVYVGSSDGNLYQLNATNISILHAYYPTGDWVSSSPVVTDDSVYVGSYDDSLYQLNATNISQLIAAYPLGSDIYSSPTAWGGRLYVADFNGLVHSFEGAAQGNVTATVPGLSFVPPTPANASTVSVNYVEVNVSATENVSDCLLAWWNQTWGTVYTMEVANDDALTYANYTVTGLDAGVQYEFFVWCNNSAGNQNQTENRTVSYYAATLIADCMNVDVSGEYALTNHVIDSATSYCMNISADNVVFDCQGYMIDGNDAAAYGMAVERSVQQVTNVTVRNCLLSDWANAALYLRQACNNTLEAVNFSSNTLNGLQLHSNSNYNLLKDVYSDSNAQAGVALTGYSLFNNLTNVRSTGNMYGLMLTPCYGNIVSGSYLMNNLESDLKLTSLPADTYCDNVFANVVGTEGRPIVYFNHTVHMRDWGNNASQIVLCNADDSVVENVSLQHNTFINNGFMLARCDHVNMTGLTLSNLYAGLHFYESSNITVTNSSVTGSRFGFQLSSGSDNLLHNNYFNNTNNTDILVIAFNNWNFTRRAGVRVYSSGPEVGGNFWANYTGYGYSETCADVDFDGFCDSPYLLASSNEDFLPLSDEYGSNTTTTSVTTTTQGGGGGGGGGGWTTTTNPPSTTTLTTSTSTLTTSTTLPWYGNMTTTSTTLPWWVNVTTTTMHFGNATTTTLPFGNATTTTLPFGNATTTTLPFGNATTTTLPLGNDTAETDTTSTTIPHVGNVSTTTVSTSTTVTTLTPSYVTTTQAPPPSDDERGERDLTDRLADAVAGIFSGGGHTVAPDEQEEELVITVDLDSRRYVEPGETFTVWVSVGSNRRVRGLNASIDVPSSLDVAGAGHRGLDLDEETSDVVTWDVLVPDDAAAGSHNLTVGVVDAGGRVKSVAHAQVNVVAPMRVPIPVVKVEVSNIKVVQDRSFTVARTFFVLLYSNKVKVSVLLLLLFGFAYLYFRMRRMYSMYV